MAEEAAVAATAAAPPVAEVVAAAPAPAGITLNAEEFAAWFGFSCLLVCVALTLRCPGRTS